MGCCNSKDSDTGETDDRTSRNKDSRSYHRTANGNNADSNRLNKESGGERKPTSNQLLDSIVPPSNIDDINKCVSDQSYVEVAKMPCLTATDLGVTIGADETVSMSDTSEIRIQTTESNKINGEDNFADDLSEADDIEDTIMYGGVVPPPHTDDIPVHFTSIRDSTSVSSIFTNDDWKSFFSIQFPNIHLEIRKERSVTSAGQERRRKTTTNITPTTADAFETLPRYLMQIGMIRQAVDILEDEQFIIRRISNLGVVRAAKVQVLDLECLRENNDLVIRTSLSCENDSNHIIDNEMAVNQEENENTIFDALAKSPELAMECDESTMMDMKTVGNITTVPTKAVSSEKDAMSVMVTSSTIFCDRVLEQFGSLESMDIDVDSDSNDHGNEVDGGQALYIIGKALHRCAFLDIAMKCYHQALYLYLLDLGAKEPRLLDQSDDCDGLFYVKISKLSKSSNSPVLRLTGAVLTKIGDTYSQMQDINNGLHAYKASQEFWKEILKNSRPNDSEDQFISAIEQLALTYKRIGAVYLTRENHAFALESYLQALELQNIILGEHDPEVGKTLHDIGVIHRHNGYWENALNYYAKAHTIFESSYGKENLTTVRALHNIGGVYRRQKAYDKALICFREVLRVRRKLLGDRHSSVSLVLVSIGSVLRHQGLKEEAYKYYARAIK